MSDTRHREADAFASLKLDTTWSEINIVPALHSESTVTTTPMIARFTTRTLLQKISDLEQSKGLPVIIDPTAAKSHLDDISKRIKRLKKEAINSAITEVTSALRVRLSDPYFARASITLRNGITCHVERKMLGVTTFDAVKEGWLDPEREAALITEELKRFIRQSGNVRTGCNQYLASETLYKRTPSPSYVTPPASTTPPASVT